MTSSTDKVLAELRRNGRPEDPVFKGGEPLYQRCTNEHVRSIQLGSGICFRCPSFSVNRGKYSEKEWVILPPNEDWGIIQFLVKHIPDPIRSPGGNNEFSFYPAHVPCETNYSHAEVRVRKDGKYSSKLKLHKEVKKKFRWQLSQLSEVVKDPSV